MSTKKVNVFNRKSGKRHLAFKNRSKQSKNKSRKGSSRAGFGQGPPEDNIKNPTNGFIYVDQDTINTYIYLKKLGWVDLSSWQPDVGEGPPSSDNPPDALTGDQYIDILTGDFYVFTEGFGWVLSNGIEGPAGPPGPSFSLDLCTTMGPTGPMVSGPVRVEPGNTVQLWINDGKLFADVI